MNNRHSDTPQTRSFEFHLGPNINLPSILSHPIPQRVDRSLPRSLKPVTLQQALQVPRLPLQISNHIRHPDPMVPKFQNHITEPGPETQIKGNPSSKNRM